MFGGGFTYVDADSPVHRCDARAKILLLLGVSIAIAGASGWWALLALTGLVVACFAVGKVPFRLVGRLLMPVYFLAAFSFACNAIASPGPGGLAAGAFFALRMLVLVATSYVVCLTSTSTELLHAFAWFIGPLRKVKAPVDDIALTLSLSVRFIPVIQQEFQAIRMAQKARGGDLTGSLGRRFSIVGSAFTALFIGLFRHADTLAEAMDARCFGMGPSVQAPGMKDKKSPR